MEILLILGVVVLIIAGSAALAIRYGYRRGDDQIKSLDKRLKKGKPGWKIWI